jgi:hypothetical protein
MATTRTFSTMLNEYLPNRMLAEDLVQRDYIFQKVTKDSSWKGGDLIVPFKGSVPSSISFGSLTAENDIAESTKVRGKIDAYREAWGSILLNHTDLMQHDGPIPESTFIRLIDDELDDFMDYYKQCVSIQMGSGPYFASVTDSTNAATGIFVVDRIDRFVIGQKATLDDDNSSATSVYVTAINLNTSSITCSATRGGAAADLSAYTAAQNARFYHPGVFDAGGAHDTFISLRNALLSATNGGGSTLHGQSKTSYPHLQALNISGADISAVNILEKLFDAYLDVRIKARGTAQEFLMSFKNWGSCMKVMETNRGAYRVVGEPKKSIYGWWETTIASTSNGESLRVVGIQEMDDDIIPIVDWRTITFRSNGLFRKRRAPDGKIYYEVRATTGYYYVIDTCLFGELEYRKPNGSGIIHTISY